MASKTVRVTLAPNHSVTLTSDAPDIGNLVSEIVKIKDEFSPDLVQVSCDSETFDEAGFKEIIVQATEEFLKQIHLDKIAYSKALTALQAGSDSSAGDALEAS